MKYGLAEKLQARRKTVILACAVIIVVAFMLKKFKGSLAPQGFHYFSVYVNVFAISLAVMFMLLPTKNIPVQVKYIIGQVVRFTPGIYCMHILIAFCLRSG